MSRPLIGQTAHTTRESQSRKKVWKPPAKLETPTPPEGYKYRLVRRTLRGVEEKENVLGRMAQHYEPVKPEELGSRGTDYQTLEDGKHAGVVTVGDLMLMKVPVEVAEQREEHYATINRRMQNAVDNDLMKENTKAMPITSNRKTTVELGTRPISIAGDEE